MKNKLLHLAAAALLTGGTAMASSFTNSLTNPNNTAGIILQGSGTMADGTTPWQPGITPDGLILTTNQGSLGASLVISDIDNQQPLESLTVTFQMLLDGAADGVAFAFGPDITDGSGIFGETGPGMGSGGFTVSFDIYNNGAPDFIGISTYLMGTEYGTTPMTLSDTAWKDVVIQLKRNGTLNMTYGGQVIYTNFALAGFFPVNGQVAFGARTGGANAKQGVRNLSITTVLKGADVAASITSQPASVTINEKESATFQVGFDGTPPFTFQWSQNGVDLPDATSNTLTLTNVLASDNGAKFKCAVANGLNSLTTSEATLTVKSDIVAPYVLSTKGSLDLTHVTVVFSKPVTTDSAENTSNYAIDNGLTVTAATLNTTDSKTVVLTTTGQKSATTHTITINGVKDTTAVGNPIAANTKTTFLSESLKVVGVGATKKFGNTTFDVGVAFNMPYDTASGTTLANYTLSGGTASAVAGLKEGVVLAVSGLQADTTYTIAVRNVKDKVGNAIVAVTNAFKVSAMQWGVVGGNEMAMGNGVIPVGDNGFDVYSDGIGEWGTYDEATLVFEEITGDFDKRLRVEYQDASSQWARAGLIARDVSNFGVDRAAQESGAAGRYQKVHVNPVTTAMGTAGNNSWEGNRRETTGAATTTAGGGGTPKYPHAWCRLQRVGQTFTIFRSDDGMTWTQLGATTFNPPMPDTVLVGPEFTPENGNVTDGLDLRGTFLAKIRDYGNYPYVPPVTGANIAWVSFHPADGTPSANAATAGFTKAADVGYTELLAANGHKVTRFVTSGTPNTALLNTFDLVIISRSVPSGDYQDAAETKAWNEITAPTVLMGGYILRNSRLGFTTGGTIPDTTNSAVRLSVKNPAHPIFAGVALDATNTMVNTYATLVSFTNLVQQGISVNTDPVAGGGTVLATIGTAGDPAFNGMVIGEWQAGAKLGNAAGDILGGHRLVFLSGSRERTITSEGSGIFDLTADGSKLFLNAVNYMTLPVVPAPKFTSITKAADGKITVTWEGGGTLQAATAVTGPWQDVPGATSPYIMTPTENMMFGRIIMK